jgi:hypothetical protein
MTTCHGGEDEDQEDKEPKRKRCTKGEASLSFMLSSSVLLVRPCRFLGRLKGLFGKTLQDIVALLSWGDVVCFCFVFGLAVRVQASLRSGAAVKMIPETHPNQRKRFTVQAIKLTMTDRNMCGPKK